MNRVTGLLTACVFALAAPAAGGDVSDVALLPGWMAEDGTRMAGVEIRLEPGWKTYWRAPGGSGIPPDFDFSGSRNLAEVRVHWPTPGVFETAGQRTIGYAGAVTFPVELRAEDPTAPIELRLGIFYGVCEEVCIPAQDSLAADLQPAALGGEAAIRAALAAVALPGSAAGIRGATCAVAPSGEDRFALRAEIAHDGLALGGDPVAVFETGSEETWITPRAISAAPGRLTVDAVLDHYGDGPLALDRGALRLTLLGAPRAIEIAGCPAP